MPDGFAGFVVLVIVLSALVALLRAGEGASKSSRGDTFWTVCPSGRGAVHCTLLRDGDTGLWRDVVRCTAFADPERLTCRKTCVTLANQALEEKANDYHGRPGM